MIRRCLLLLLPLGLLAACSGPVGDAYSLAATGGDGAAFHEDVMPDARAQSLAYSHQLEVEIASDRLIRRFDELRALCLSDRALGCTLLNTAQNTDHNSYYAPVARLTVRLPHDGVAKFEEAVLAPVGEGRGGKVKIRSRSTAAEDLSVPIADVDRRLAQLTDYRERLTALAKRTDTRAEELIKIEGELANTQKQIEELSAEQRGLNRRVDTELLTVELYRAPTLGTAWAPIGSAFSNAGQTLGENVGEAVRFTIAVVPFLPLVALAFALASFGWKLFRRIQGRPASQGKTPPGP